MIKEYGYEYDAVLNKSLWRDTRGKVTGEKLFNAYCFRSGRDTLKAIAREYKPCVALLPALACDSMVFPFEMYGHEVRYYRLNADYSIDLDSLKIGNEQALFLYMNYFGKPAIRDGELKYLRNKGNIVFIEDWTHNFIWDRVSGFKPDYIMVSLRKWLSVPDGALLWGKVSQPLAADTSFSSTRLKAQCMRHKFLSCGNENIKTKYRKILTMASDIMDKDEPSAMSAYTYALVRDIDWNQLQSIRKGNAEKLISVLQTSRFITFIQDKPGLSDLYVAIIVPNRDEVQRKLSAEGIFNTIIWPLSEVQKEACQVAKFTEEHMMAVPCDQRYTVDDMKYIGAEIVRVIEDVNR